MRSLSPLRYPGGKSRAAEYLVTQIPSGVKVASPFFGGGSVELLLASNGVDVRGYDVFNPLVEFWQCLSTDPERLANEAAAHLPLSKVQFYALQQTQSTGNSKYTRAAKFFVLNRASFSGSTLSGGMSPKHPRFNKSAIDRVRSFDVEGFSVSRKAFHLSIPENADRFLYLDPPYIIKSMIYGVKGSTHRGFDHVLLSQLLHSRTDWLLSYNDCPEVRNLYKGYRIETPTWKYGMSKKKESSEVLIYG